MYILRVCRYQIMNICYIVDQNNIFEEESGERMKAGNKAYCADK